MTAHLTYTEIKPKGPDPYCEMHRYNMPDGHCTCPKTVYQLIIISGSTRTILTSKRPFPQGIEVLRNTSEHMEQLSLFPSHSLESGLTARGSQPTMAKT